MTVAAGDQLGTSNSGYMPGDIDDDGKDDLLIGPANANEAYVFLGNDLAGGTNIDATVGTSISDALGISGASRELNGDGRSGVAEG